MRSEVGDYLVDEGEDAQVGYAEIAITFRGIQERRNARPSFCISATPTPSGIAAQRISGATNSYREQSVLKRAAQLGSYYPKIEMISDTSSTEGMALV